MKYYYLGLVGFLGLLGLFYPVTGSPAWLGFLGFFGWFGFFRVGAHSDERLGSNFNRAARNGFFAVMLITTLVGVSVAVTWVWLGGSPVSLLFFAWLTIVMAVGYAVWGVSMAIYDRRGD
ncbi:MAG: DUF3796 domain-containing protein [Candidatus Hermodarchaeota archaeon]|jgi:hypothetical protein|nr:DUF3796 domain-containing protein [Candidatus Hermodarchaeota archaeon]